MPLTGWKRAQRREVRIEFGRFLELSLGTADIASSVLFYERLGFGQYITGDAWPHRYGVVSDGRVHLGLHESSAFPALAVSFVLPQLEHARNRLQSLAIIPEVASLGAESLNQLRLRDPAGHAVLLLEARTYSPTPLSRVGESLCGYFLHLSVPQPDFQAARAFWETGGLIGLEAEQEPYPHLPLTSDELNLAFHPIDFFAAPLLVFASPELRALEAQLAQLDVPRSRHPASAPANRQAVLIKAPEGTALLLVQAPS